MDILTLVITAVLLNFFAFFTIVTRPKLYKTTLFKPMIWNLKLSVLPLVTLVGGLAFSLALRYISSNTQSGFFDQITLIVFGVTLLAWILFLPNSGYLITELNLTHRNEDSVNVPIWYDIISVLSLALSGVVNSLLNIVLIQLCILVLFDPVYLTTGGYLFLFSLALFIILLINIGIYLGREIRFNSWDVLHPIQFIKKMIHHFKVKANRINFLLFVFFHTAFFLIMYTAFGIPFYFFP